MPKIFISYRRNDSRTITGRIYDRLSAEFGSDNIFRDINAIPLGSDFPTVIERELASCDFLLAIIGSRWVSITDEQGRRRLDDPTDFVRIEVETALRLPDVTVIPVYVDGVPGLSSSDLPPTLAKLPRRNAAFVRDDPDFHSDVDKLIASIRKIAPISEPIEAANVPKSSPTANALGGKFIIGILALIVVIVVIVTIASVLNPGQGVIPTPTPLPTQVVAAESVTTAPFLTPTDAPTLAPTLTPEPSLTPLPPSVTLSPTDEPTVTPLPPSPTDAPTPIPPSPLPSVSISIPTVVLPNTTILVTAWQNAHCIFKPDDGNIPFGFDTSTGNIQYSVKHKAGTNVSIICEDAQGRHEENQFVVSAAAIPTTVFTPTVTNSPIPPTFTFTSTITNTPSYATPTPIIKAYPCNATVKASGPTILKVVRQFPTSSDRKSINAGQEIIILSINRNNASDLLYHISDKNGRELGYIPVEYVVPSIQCPVVN